MTTGEVLRLAFALLPFVGTVLVWLLRLHRGRRILQFDRRKNLDVVISTSCLAPPLLGVPAVRPLTGFGQMRGVASCTRAMSRLYPRKLISLHFSDLVRGTLDSDLVLLGGPGKNDVTRSFLGDFREQYDLTSFEFDDEGRNIAIAVDGHQRFEHRPFTPGMQTTGRNSYPTDDIGLIILARRIGDKGGESRCILCAGMTTYGTAAAAEYLFGQLVRMPRWRARKVAGIRWFGRRDMIIVVKGEFNDGDLESVRPLASYRLRPWKPAASRDVHRQAGMASRLT